VIGSDGQLEKSHDIPTVLGAYKRGARIWEAQFALSSISKHFEQDRCCENSIGEKTGRRNTDQNPQLFLIPGVTTTKTDPEESHKNACLIGL
jgi:hypothetical protein